ncbi:MAG: ABC transporter ATP-binding protein [Lachnospiraceae bacterium]|jgi:multiple sugar transport system ATP-binding protein|nr:ABC transporter ATP-binding protein [Lachnospiraceae bacterium]
MEVRLQNLTKKFPSRDRKNRRDVIAVNDFTFEIPDGKLIGLLGPSGCGKSTTLNLISGLVKPSSGRIFFGSDDVTDLPPEHRGIGLVFQNYALYPHLTVRQNIIFPLENLKGKDRLSKAQMLEKAGEAARLVQIGELMDRKPGELSGGQQQRVAIARALVKRPRVLLLDEPLSNLDARLRLQTREEIRRIQRETGITTIFVTHDQEEAMSISDMIVVMKDGVVQQIGKPQEVYDNPANLFVAKFLGTPPINVFDGSVRNGRLYIGEDAVLEIGPSADREEEAEEGTVRRRVDGTTDREVYAAIRPEGFLLQKEGVLRCELSGVEVMGRDISVISRNRASLSSAVRSIIGSEYLGKLSLLEGSSHTESYSSKDGYSSMESHSSREGYSSKESHSSKEGYSSKESHSSREGYSSKESHSFKEGHSSKESYSSKEGHSSKESPSSTEWSFSMEQGRGTDPGQASAAGSPMVRFGLLPRKVFLFDSETQQRIAVSLVTMPEDENGTQTR